MIRDFMVTVSEALFWLMGGVPLANSLWFFAWVIILGVLLGVVLFYTAVKANERPLSGILLLLFVFFPFLLLGMGPPLVQMQLLAECRQETAIVKVENYGNVEQNMKVCRYKENHYGDFGEWQLVTGKQPR